MGNASTEYWQRLDAEHFLHPFTDTKSLMTTGARVVVKGEGIYLHDSAGNRILDGMSGLWCVNVGYGRAELIDAAYRQLQALPYYHAFFGYSHPAAIELADTLIRLTAGAMSRVFFTSSGSEANDTVIRMVRRYWDLEGQPARKVIISRKQAYHGSTMGSASLGGMASMHAQGELPIPGIVHIDMPGRFANLQDESEETYGLRMARALATAIEEIGPERVAAFIGEPIPGGGGVLVPPHNYWTEVQNICRRYDILLVADEVICGFGRIGHWFGGAHYGIQPDLISVAKGLTSGYQPLGAVLVSTRVADVLVERGGEFSHGFTYSGHPVACAVALANIEVLEKDKLLQKVRQDVGPYLQQRWREFGDHPLVGEVRGYGMLAALELVAEKTCDRGFPADAKVGEICRRHAFEYGLVMRAVQDTMIVAPPLITERSQVDELIGKIFMALDRTASEVALLRR